MDSTVQEDVVRPHKKRKVFRRRRDSNDQDEQSITASYKPDSNEPTSVDADETPSMHERARRPKKHGIAFSSDHRSSRQPESAGSPIAIVPYDRAMEVAQDDRFVRATGRAMVSEDKHMSAFIDARLAESRTKTISAAAQAETTELGSEAEGSTIQLPATNRDRLKMQPIPRKNQKPRPWHRRRQPIGPSETEIARDELVDQIMRDGPLPIYDNKKPDPIPDHSNDNIDNDAAAAAAFKADFLASMQDSKYARKPTIQANASTSGPKLGGSRMARERMKAFEEQTKIPPGKDSR